MYQLTPKQKAHCTQQLKKWYRELRHSRHRCQECGQPVPYDTMMHLCTGAPAYLCQDCEFKVRMRQAKRDEQREFTTAVYQYMAEVRVRYNLVS